MDIQELSDAIGVIYEIPLDASKWMEVQALLAKHSNTIANHILVFDGDAAVTASSMYSQWGEQVAAEANKEYNDYYYQFDTGKSFEYAAKMQGKVITNAEITSEFEKRNCPLENEFNTKFQCEQQLIIGSNVNENFVSIISTRPKGDEFEQADKEIFGMLSGHIIKAISHSAQIQSMFGHQFSYEKVLTDKNNATLVIDSELNIVWQSKAAKVLLTKEGDLKILNSKLDFNNTLVRDELNKSFELALEERAKEKEKCYLHKIHQNHQDLVMAVFSSKRQTLFATDKQYVATLVIRVPTEFGEEEIEKLKTLFGLSPTEAKLAANLANGLSLQEYAALNHRSMNTVRSTLKRTMLKTRTSSQATLVALIHQSV